MNWLEIAFYAPPANKEYNVLHYATRLPPGKPVELLDNGLIRKTCQAHSEAWFEFMDALINHFIKQPDPLVVPVYDYRVLKTGRDDCTYSYDMMRCGILSTQERALINIVGNLHDRHGIDACKQDNEDLRCKSKEFPKLFDFLKEVVEQNRYWDLHSGNVMMDEDYNYVLVDLEGFIRTPLCLRENNWILR